ncbi:GNAT family protein [Streptomyces sp. NPDC013178]|uniref:GNAT family N-acetyltransferase n=1 Tax=Streptomyces sp. NPDC013178 TaxID=3155118 RepID=UPI003405EEA7
MPTHTLSDRTVEHADSSAGFPSRPFPLVHTSSGIAVTTRRGEEGDFPAVAALHARCSAESLYSRYMSGRRELRLAEWRHLTDPAAGWTWVSAPADQPQLIIAVTHILYSDGADRSRADLGILVEDGWQGQRLGSELVRSALSRTGSEELREVVVMTNGGNVRMIRIARAMGAVVPRTFSFVIEMTLSPK